VIYFAIPSGKRLGRRTDTTEETQVILSGSGDLLLDEGSKPIKADEGSKPIKAGDVFVLTEEVWEPGDLMVTASPNA